MARKRKSDTSTRDQSKCRCPDNLAMHIKVTNLFRQSTDKFAEWKSFKERYLPIMDSLAVIEIRAVQTALAYGFDPKQFSKEKRESFIDFFETHDFLAAYLVFEPVYKYRLDMFALTKEFPESTEQILKECFFNYDGSKRNTESLYKFAKSLNEIRKGTRDKTDIPSVDLQTLFFISDENKVDIKTDLSVINAVRGIDPDRLRICAICENIFWAARFDSETCSKKCANKLRIYNYRQLTTDEKEQLKLKRQVYRQTVKSLREKRNKRNKNNVTL